MTDERRRLPDPELEAGSSSLDLSFAAGAPLNETAEASPPPFSIFTKGEKWALVAMVAFGGMFSPMSANIYFPAIPLLASDFHVSISLMNLTVTVYLIFQGLSPMFWAPLADVYGRRPMYLGCLFLLSITCVALALVPTDKWWLLLIFRCFQASGSASTVALSFGIVSDIATPAERGGLIGLAGLGALVGRITKYSNYELIPLFGLNQIGPCIGPIIGGLLAGNLGWRWIFWFLCIMSSTCLLFMLLFLPETLRRIVGNGSALAPVWDRPLIPIIGPYRRRGTAADSEAALALKRSSPKKQSMNPFRLFLEKDIICMLIANGVVYGLFVGVQASASLLFQNAYPHLTQSDIGLCFLPMGLGAFFSSVFSGKLLDWQYRKDRVAWEQHKKQSRADAGHEKLDAPFSAEEELEFPIEHARLKWVMWFTFILVAVTVGFGWAIDKKAPLAVPLILQFIQGWSTIGEMNGFQTLLMDAFPKQGSSTTAINNFVRCLLGAGLVSIINIILNALGTGWTYTLLGGICIIFTPLFTVVVMRLGPRWRLERTRKLAARA